MFDNFISVCLNLLLAMFTNLLPLTVVILFADYCFIKSVVENFKYLEFSRAKTGCLKTFTFFSTSCSLSKYITRISFVYTFFTLLFLWTVFSQFYCFISFLLGARKQVNFHIFISFFLPFCLVSCISQHISWHVKLSH